jgi:Ubiquitin carboxyl-terminal hydrolase
MGGACCSSEKIQESRPRSLQARAIVKKNSEAAASLEQARSVSAEDKSPKGGDTQEGEQKPAGDYTLLPESEVKLQSEQWLFLDIATLPYRDLNLVPPLGQAAVNGFTNQGVNCYMNVVFQVIVNMPGVKEYFIGNIHQKEAIAEGKPQLEDSFVGRFGELVQVYHSYNDYILEPTRLLQNIAQNHKLFNASLDQEDAHEFLMYVIDRLATDLNRYTVIIKK